MSSKCTRTMTCRCDDCTAAMGMFSAKDLVAVSSSKVDFSDEQQQHQQATIAEAPPAVKTTTPPATTTTAAPAPAPAASAAAAAAPKAALKPWQVKRPQAVAASAMGDDVSVQVFATPVQPPAAPPVSSSEESTSKPSRVRTGPKFTKPPSLLPVAPVDVGEQGQASSLVNEDDEAFARRFQAKQSLSLAPPPQPPSFLAPPAQVGRTSLEDIEVFQPRPSSTLQTAMAQPPAPELVEERVFRPISAAETTTTTVAAASAMAEVEEDEDFSALPLEERISSAKWKARQSAYLEISQTRGDCAHLLDKAIETEINPANQDVLLEAMVRCVQVSDEERPGRWISSLAKRCFAGRPSVAQRSIDLVMELFACDPPEAVGNALLAELTNKNAKVVVASLKCIRTACALFGPGQVVPMPCILKAVETGMSAIPPATRAEAFALALEVIAWLGEDFVALLNSKLASDTQRRELERKIAEERRPGEVVERKRATRFRKDATASSSTATHGSGSHSSSMDAANTAPVDVYDLLPAADILSKLDRAPIEFEKRVSHHEWKVRKLVLEEVEALCGKPPKLVTSMDYSPLVNSLKKVIANDTNQAVVIQALNLLAALSEGLRASFAFLARICLVVLLEKYREQKLAGAVDQCLDSFCHWSFQIGDERSCAQIGETFANPKCTPVQLLQTIKWIERAVMTFGKRNANVDFEPLRNLVRQHALAHRNPNVRQAANSALNALKDNAVALAPLVKPPPSQAPPPPAAAAAAVGRQPQPPKQNMPSSANAPSSRLAARTGAAVVAAVTPQPIAAASAALVVNPAVIDKLAKNNVQFAQALATSSSNSDLVLRTLFDAAQDEDEFTYEELDGLARFVGSKTKEWTDQALFTPLASDCLLAFFDRAPGPNLSEYYMGTVLAATVNAHQANLLSEFTVIVGPAVCMHRVSKLLRSMSSRATKLFALEWLAKCLLQFDLVVLHELDDFSRCLAQEHTGPAASTDEAVKQACVQVWCELCKQLGEQLFQNLVSPLLPSALVMDVVRKVHIAMRSAKQQQQAPREVWRFQPNLEEGEELGAHLGQGVEQEMMQEQAMVAVEEELGVTLQLLEKLLPVLNTSDVAQWKKREDALEQLEQLLLRCTPSSLPPSSKTSQGLAAALCKRLDDAQRNLAARAATCIGLLCNSVGPSGSALLLKQCLGPSLLHNLADRKPQISQACHNALTLAVLHQGLVSLPCLGQVILQSIDLLHKNRADKVKVLAWLADRLEEVENQQHHLAVEDGMEEEVDSVLRNVFLELLPALLLLGFTAKEAAAKRSAIRIAEIAVSFLPEQLALAKFRGAVRDLKSADQRLVDPIVEEVMRRAQAANRARRGMVEEEGFSPPQQQLQQHMAAASSSSANARTSRFARSPSPTAMPGMGLSATSASRGMRPNSPTPMTAAPRASSTPQQTSRFTSPVRSISQHASAGTPPPAAAGRPSYPSPAQLRPSTPPPPLPQQQQQQLLSRFNLEPESAKSTTLSVYQAPHAKFERQIQMMIDNIFAFEQALLQHGQQDNLPFPHSREMLLLTRLETSIAFMKSNLTCSPAPHEIDETEWERLVEDLFSAAAVLDSFDQSLKHLIMTSSGNGSGEASWRLGAWQGKVARLCLAGAVALASKRSIRISLDSESFTLTLIQLHPLAARDEGLAEAVELTFRSIQETSAWLPTVLSLRDEPADFVKRQVREFCLEQERAESPFFFVNLEECFELVTQRDRHWVDPSVVALFRRLLGNGSSSAAAAVGTGAGTVGAEQKRMGEDAGLREIFNRIISALESSDAESCRSGIEDLRKFKALNQELFAMLDPLVYLEGTAPLFQEYIVEKLNDPLFASEAGAGGTPGGGGEQAALQVYSQHHPPASKQPSTPSSEIKRRLEQMRNRSQLRMLSLPVVPMNLDEIRNQLME